ncbi:MAG: hypothetical protein CVU48_07125 [Candidatus Cloacimonetes bacterium HGW-Cloacimonetes-1]|nr:MAG: hypothetical protein CVU48_07125 [Candidatus Cloacimonetes bacterium HGW-Cloacimonetes-1]
MKHLKISLLMLLACASGMLFGMDNKFLNRINHLKKHPVYNIVVNDQKAILYNQNQVWVYSMFNPWKPQVECSFYSTYVIEGVDLMGGKYLYISSREPTNNIVEIDSLNQYGKIFFPNLITGDKITREGSILYVADHQRGIDIIDIGSGGIKETKSAFSEKWGVRDFQAEYPYLYALNDFGLVTVDVSDLRFPTSIGSNYQINEGTKLKKNEDIVWVVSGKVLMAINIQNLSNPILVNQYRFAYEILDIEIKNNRLFAALGYGGVRIMDISNPLRISELNWINYQGTSLDVALDKDMIYIATGKEGWLIYEYR